MFHEAKNWGQASRELGDHARQARGNTPEVLMLDWGVGNVTSKHRMAREGDTYVKELVDSIQIMTERDKHYLSTWQCT